MGKGRRFRVKKGQFKGMEGTLEWPGSFTGKQFNRIQKGPMLLMDDGSRLSFAPNNLEDITVDNTHIQQADQNNRQLAKEAEKKNEK